MSRTTNGVARWGFALAAIAAIAVQTPSCANGGIGGTGNISGFGSIFVNGVEWFTDSATVLLDGAEGTEADLQLGMVVLFEGSIDASRLTGIVSRVRFDDDIEGPVASITTASKTQKTLQIFGQTVSIEEGFTFFDALDPTLGFDSIGVGDVLEVSGYPDDAGAIRASWVRRTGTFTPGSTHVELEGSVLGLGPGPSFQLGPVTIATTAATDLSELSEDLEEGLAVEVEGTAMSHTLVVASRIGIPEAFTTSVAELSLEGVVTSYVSLADFQVAGQQVDASNATFVPPGAAFLADGVLVEVEGPLVGGVLLADEVELELPALEIAAPLAAASHIDPVGRRLWLLGRPLEVTPTTELVDERDELPAFSLFDIAPGDFLEVEGFRTLTGQVHATALIRTEAGEINVSGPVDDFDTAEARLVVLGILLQANGGTKFKDRDDLEISSAAFFDALEIGTPLQATALSLVGPGQWLAEEIELGD